MVLALASLKEILLQGTGWGSEPKAGGAGIWDSAAGMLDPLIFFSALLCVSAQFFLSLTAVWVAPEKDAFP